MAAPAWNTSARRDPVAVQSHARCRHQCRSGSSDRRRCDGTIVQGDRCPFAAMAGARGVRMTIVYRDATADDAATLDRIFETTFCDTFGHLYRAEDLDAFRSSFCLADWEAELRD